MVPLSATEGGLIVTMWLIATRLSVQIDAREEQHELSVQDSAGSCQMFLIPAKSKTSSLQLSSWVFDGGMEKDCLYAAVKVEGIGTCSTWISKDQEQI